MGRTSQVLKAWILEGARPTIGCLSDYGFDHTVYANEPDEAALEELKLRYKEILEENEDMESKLHKALTTGKLHELLGQRFSWVRSISCPLITK